jgi:hypothetical protein
MNEGGDRREDEKGKKEFFKALKDEFLLNYI